jgi:hypothetical protein
MGPHALLLLSLGGFDRAGRRAGLCSEFRSATALSQLPRPVSAAANLAGLRRVTSCWSAPNRAVEAR